MKTRRELLRFAGLGLTTFPLTSLFGCRRAKRTDYKPLADEPFQGTDEQLLEEIQRTAFRFFWNESSERTGQTKDRAAANGNDTHTMSSIAATGFGLTTLCIGHKRDFRDAKEIEGRVRRTLRFLANELRHEHGFFYHFIHIETGARWETVELSSIDTSLLLCGVLMARQYFVDQEIKELATNIYERVDWPWMLNGGKTLSMGWKPESGFLSARWEQYCELMIIYLLGLGSPTHSLPPETWDAWTRPTVKYHGLEYISGNDPIFTHQYSQAWFDFRGKRDQYANYFENSVTATKAHKLFCLSLHEQFPDYSEDLWGISASDYAKGYTAWGGPPAQGPIDGTIVPCATGGSLPFLFDDCMKVLRTLRGPYAKRVWSKYGFLDAFNPLTGWYDADVLGIDQGIIILMAENHRTGFVWDVFMRDESVKRGMERAGFRPEPLK